MSPNAVARAVVVVVGVLVLVAGASGAVLAFRTAITSDDVDAAVQPDNDAAIRQRDRIHHAQFECIRVELGEQLAPGTTVYVPLDPTTFEADLWQQRLIELAYPLAAIADEPGPGTATLRIAPDPGGRCSGVRLVVEPG